MKLLDSVVTKAIEASALVKGLIKSVDELTAATEMLAKNLAITAHNQHVHHQMIGKMWAMQQAILKKMSENSVNLALPEPNSAGQGGKKDADKPN